MVRFMVSARSGNNMKITTSLQHATNLQELQQSFASSIPFEGQSGTSIDERRRYRHILGKGIVSYQNIREHEVTQ